MDAQEDFQKLFAIESFDGLETDQALDHLGRLIDRSLDLGRLDGTHKAIQLAESLWGRSLSSPHSSLLHYYLANAWANVGLLSRSGPDAEWAWERPEVEKEIIHLRRAIREQGFQGLPSVSQCQVFTNLGNLFSQVGRFIEAQERWNEALSIEPRFTMALGNRGRGRFSYSKAVYDDGHKLVFLRHAFADLDVALSAPRDDPWGIHTDAQMAFQKYRDWISKHLPKSELRKGTRMKDFPLGKSKQEVNYRKWCLGNCLFLNPLNDLGNTQ